MLDRRTALKMLGAGLVAATAPLSGNGAPAASTVYKAKNGRIRQSVVAWCFKPMPVEELAEHAARLGLQSVELVTPEHWPALKRHGLTCAIASSHGFAKGFAHKEEHAQCLQILRQRIDEAAQAGYSNVITFSGFRRGLSDAEGQRNMVEGLKQIVGYAEQKTVTLCLEMLNSRVNIEMKGHPDYFCDRIEPTVEVCRLISSERMKILFDIYHVQIMEGDLISRIKQFHPYIGHYHTAGVPGRGELDDQQEATIILQEYRGAANWTTSRKSITQPL
jgi:hydroxypyruvate isomerase